MEKRFTSGIVLAAFGLCAIIAAIPLFGVTYPPLNDLPNHVGRIAVLGAPPGDPLLDYYEIRWQVIPNLGTDILLLGISQVMSLATASKVLFALCATLWLLAPLALHRVVHGRLSIVPLTAGLFLFNRVEDLGFLNFWLGSSLAVIGFAAWVALAERPTRTRALVGAAITIVLFLCHLFAVATFAVAIAAWELVPGPDGRRSRPVRTLALLAVVLLPAAIGLLLGPRDLVTAAARFGYQGSDLLAILDAKLQHLLAFVPGGAPRSVAAFGLLGLLLVASVAMRTIDRRLAAIPVVLFALFLVLPYRLMTGTHVDWRMLAPVVLFASGVAAIELRRWQTVAAAAVLVAGVAIQASLVAGTWQGREATLRAFEPVVAQVPSGAMLFYAATGPRDEREHYGGYAVVERRAVVPSLFAFPAQQPIRVAEPYRSAHRGLERAWYADLATIEWNRVTADFEYVLLASAEPPAVPATLAEVATNGPFRLYRVTGR